MMKIAIIGTGYVGLVTGTCFSDVGIEVTCVDIDRNKIDILNQGKIPIYEPGLEDMVKRNLEKKRLRFTTGLPEAIKGCEAVFIAVGTPPDEDGSADLKYVIDVAEEIGKNMDSYLMVVNKSTVPVGTSELVKEAIRKQLRIRKADIPFDVASNPEFLKEGDAINDFLKPDRIVVGTDSERAEELMQKLYKPFTLNGHPVIFMDVRSSEMTKYAANAMLATRISFMNDLANLCELTGANINKVRKGIGSDSRIGNKFLYPGTGYGGSCFPKDVKALIKTGADNGHILKVLTAVEEVNEAQKSALVKKIKNHFGNSLPGMRAAIWGLTFKPHTDDMREAPSLVIIEALLSEGVAVCAYDPVAMNEAKRILDDRVEFAHDQYEALKEADFLVIPTEWPEFRFPSFDTIMERLKTPAIFDGRNIYDADEMKQRGFYYYCIGIKTT